MSTIEAEPLRELEGSTTLSGVEMGIGSPDSGARALRVIKSIFKANWGSICLTYVLFAVENLLCVIQPYVLGLAIDGLLKRSYEALGWFAVQHLGHLVIGVARRAYDTRMFGRIHADLVTQIVLDHRRRDVEVTRVVARSALSREFVEFFEQQVPIVIQTAFLMIGGLAILATYDTALVNLCVALIVPACVLNTVYARRTFALSGRLHDALEREVDVIHRGEPAEIREHYETVAHCQIGLSDSEAKNFGTMELFVLALVVGSLVLSCGGVAATPGEIQAVLRYVWMFVNGLDGLPYLIQQMSRLCDVGRRCTDSSIGLGAEKA
jgi:ABC-type multidrug transport system fused ATPase/permease subunit